MQGLTAGGPAGLVLAPWAHPTTADCCSGSSPPRTMPRPGNRLTQSVSTTGALPAPSTPTPPPCWTGCPNTRRHRHRCDSYPLRFRAGDPSTETPPRPVGNHRFQQVHERPARHGSTSRCIRAKGTRGRGQGFRALRSACCATASRAHPLTRVPAPRSIGLSQSERGKALLGSPPRRFGSSAALEPEQAPLIDPHLIAVRCEDALETYQRPLTSQPVGRLPAKFDGFLARQTAVHS